MFVETFLFTPNIIKLPVDFPTDRGLGSRLTSDTFEMSVGSPLCSSLF